ncbi:hypothetical protein JCGZ_17258 [Jatropha curcas]|uniref:CWF19-like protein 2 n=2 Tax=Jatropha curcas TaxID=180498 RepID=A0A067LB05_JATCU|nr:hypothetical protein JCGZ_17258 [Jatropha curcas]
MDKHRRKRKNSHYSSGSDDSIGKINKGSRKKKKWYSSDDYSSEDSSDDDSDYSSDKIEKEQRNRRKNKRGNNYSSGNEYSDRSKKRPRSGKKHDSSSSAPEDEGYKGSGKGGSKKYKEKGGKSVANDLTDDGREDIEITRKEMGLDWMLRPADRRPAVNVDEQPEKPALEEMKSVDPRELNPYLKDNGSGYPDDAEEKRKGNDQLPPSSVVGDGGASWRLKALKRAQEQAKREGRKLEEVVEERWGSLGQLAVSAVSHTAAPARAHLHAIKSRRRGLADETDATDQCERDVEKNRGHLKDVSVRHPEMRAPKVRNSLSWGKHKGQNVPAKDESLISAAVSSLNKFADDGSFMSKVFSQQNNDPSCSVGSQTNQDENVELKVASSELNKPSEGFTTVKEALSANQLAAKALQLRMKGKHEEADKLMQEAENLKVKQGNVDNSSKPQKVGSTKRYVVQDISARRKEEDADRHLAQKIIQNKQYSLSGRADNEYDFEDGPSRKSKKKGIGNDHKSTEKNVLAKRILTQQERCLFCFENPIRPKHLVVSIANFTYLMLPQWQPVVPGHCCILPLQHESATRMVDNNVWEEIRNFKKCLIMMFAKQEKDLVFLETVMGLAKQRRHCLIECIPLPREIARQAPLYFKKAIDEAEDEWSQHNAKKLIDTSVKGLRNSIPKDFPYFHVEFGLNKGFVHVIDDEEQFKSSLGLNVIRGMLQLPEEDMHRRRRHESVEAQKQAVAHFVRDWEPFDWTKQLS